MKHRRLTLVSLTSSNMFRIFLFVLACCAFGSASPGQRYSGNENELLYEHREIEQLLKRAEEPQLAEVPIVGKPSGQSSTYTYVQYGPRLSADLANDGNSDSNLHNGRSCSQTKLEGNPWWTVDLGASHVITKVEINRGEAAHEHLEGAIVRVAMGKVQGLESGVQCGSPVTAGQASVSNTAITFKCDPGIEGQIIVIGIPRNSAYLRLCEVRVWEEINM